MTPNMTGEMGLIDCLNTYSVILKNRCYIRIKQLCLTPIQIAAAPPQSGLVDPAGSTTEPVPANPRF